jgi:hypothetical protein
MKKNYYFKIYKSQIEKQKLMWPLAQVLPDILIAFCMPKIVFITARQKLQATC